MSRLKRDIRGKKLRKLLSRADDESFFQLIWAVNALQTDRVSVARRFIRFPPAAATSDLSAQYAIHAWELETLANEVLIIPKAGESAGRNRFVNCSLFGAAVAATNLLRGQEDAEAGLFLRRYPVLTELHRIGQRIFPWQRGYFNLPQFYRSAFIYGQARCAEYFHATAGLTFDQFALVGFGLYGYLNDNAFFRNFSMEEVGISADAMKGALKLLCVSVEDAKKEAGRLRQAVSDRHRRLPIAYQPSLLRKFPLVSFEGRLRSPLPELVLLRVTAGLFYDLVGGGGDLRNEAGNRFEEYCHRLLSAMLPKLQVSRSHRYKLQSNLIESPDLSISKDGVISLVLECKSTKLSFGAQFANDPIGEASAGYDELAKGIFQIWRYISHIRRGILTADVSPAACGAILTPDTWLVLSRELRDDLLERANELAKKDAEILAVDRRKIVFCAVQELEGLLMISDEDRFLGAIAAATEDRFIGWQLPNVHREIGNDLEAVKPYPFELGEVLPSWEKVMAMKASREIAHT